MNGLYGTPLTGMRGANFELDVVANNIANLNTSGFEQVDPVLSSLGDQAAIGELNYGTNAGQSTQAIGMGTRPEATNRTDLAAPLVQTGNPLDLVVKQPGMFVLRQPDGQIVYTPQVTLQLQPDGRLLTAQGQSLVPQVRVPANVSSVVVDTHGNLIGQTRTGTTVPLGRPEVATFAAPDNLRALGAGNYAESLSSGRPQTAGAGALQILSGYQLGSTVDLATQMVNMIQAERMYEINGKALQTVDSLIGTVISISPR